MGVDYGTKRIGLAISTPEQTIASPFEVRPRRAQAEELRYFRELTRDYRLAGLVVGWPIHISGEESEKSREARQFALWLAGVTNLPAGLWDERFTSAVAEEQLLAAELTKKRRKERIDMLAAQILLQAFLDHRAGQEIIKV